MIFVTIQPGRKHLPGRLISTTIYTDLPFPEGDLSVCMKI